METNPLALFPAFQLFTFIQVSLECAFNGAFFIGGLLSIESNVSFYKREAVGINFVRNIVYKSKFVLRARTRTNVPGFPRLSDPFYSHLTNVLRGR